MMSVSEYALSVDLSVAEVLKKCRELNINASNATDELTDDDIIFLDNTLNLISNDNDIIHFTNVKYNGYNYIYRGSISSNSDIKVVSTIPYYDSFEIYVDDNIVDYYIIDDAFIGFDVSSGDHRININYYPKGYKKGIIISVISFILFLCFIRWEQLFYKVNNKLK